MPLLFEPNAITFNADNAALLAEAANMAYKTEPVVKKWAEKNGFSEFQWIDDLSKIFQDLQAFVVANDDIAVLSFRGSASFEDWMTDFNASPVEFNWVMSSGPNVGHVHAGIGHSLADAWEKINVPVNKVAPPPKRNTSLDAPSSRRTLWVTGHSLGGGLAVLAGAAYMLVPTFMRSVSGIYTFGQPRVGIQDFCVPYDRILAARTFRFINKKDLVPRVPFRGMDYGDVGRMIHFESDGTPKIQGHEWRGWLSRTFESFAEFGEIITHLRPDAGDHSMDEYASLVAKNRTSLSNPDFIRQLS